MDHPGSGKSEADLNTSFAGGNSRNVLQSAGTSTGGKFLKSFNESFGVYNLVIFVCQWCHWREKASDLQIFSFAVDHGECILLMMLIKAVPCSCCSLKFRPQADQSSVGSIWTRAVQIYQVHKEEIRVCVEKQKEWWRTPCSRVWLLLFLKKKKKTNCSNKYKLMLKDTMCLLPTCIHTRSFWDDAIGKCSLFKFSPGKSNSNSNCTQTMGWDQLTLAIEQKWVHTYTKTITLDFCNYQ